MKNEREFTDSHVDVESTDEKLEFESDDTFLSVLPTDRSGKNEDETSDEADLISSFKPHNNMANGARDEAFAYIQEIGNPPLLTPAEEIEYFQQFETARQKGCRLIFSASTCGPRKSAI